MMISHLYALAEHLVDAGNLRGDAAMEVRDALRKIDETFDHLSERIARLEGEALNSGDGSYRP